MGDTLVVIQARVGSTRLPGKVMYPLDGKPVIGHVIARAVEANVGRTVVATSTEPRDDVLAHCVPEYGVDLVRGSESDVIDRFRKAIDVYEPSIVARVTADCPLLSSDHLCHVVRAVERGADYGTSGMARTFPSGITAEAFSASSFHTVYEKSTEPRHREHVTIYYKEHPEEFEVNNVVSSDFFEDEKYQDRTDVRLALDEPNDYRLLRELFRRSEGEEALSVAAAIDLVDKHGLATLNEFVS